VREKWVTPHAHAQAGANHLLTNEQGGRIAASWTRCLAVRNEGAIRHADARQIEDRPEVKGKPGAAGMITSRGVDEERVGALLERAHGALEQRPDA